MKLLFDQNLSPRLVATLIDLFPGSAHVDSCGLGTVSDVQIWDYARLNDFIIVTKDADFSELGMMRGFPPKLIWLRMGNCTTDQVESVIRLHIRQIEYMAREPAVGFLSVG